MPRPTRVLRRFAILLWPGVLLAEPAGAAPHPPPTGLPILPDPHGSRAMATERGGQWFDSQGWDVTSYHFDLRIDPAAAALEGEARATVTRLGGGPFRIHVPEGSSPVVEVDGALVDASVDLDTVLLDDPGSDFQLTVSWSGGGASGGLGLHFDPSFVYTWAEPYGARNWLAVVDDPADKAAVSWSIAVPPGQVAVANGIPGPVTTDPDGWARFGYDADFPLAPYLMAVAVAELEEAVVPGPVPISIWATPDRIEEAAELLADTGEILQWLSSRFTPYPWPRYGNIVVPGLGGAMEHTTAVAFGGDFDPENWQWVNVHEAAHHWWGDLVTLGTFDDLWLHEGWASYTEALWFEDRIGVDARKGWMQRKADRYRLAVGKEGSFPVAQPDELFSRTVYDKGAWVVHMLRGAVGDEVFDAGARRYLDTHALGTATSADLRAAFEEEAGEDLGWFFEPWLELAGEPRWVWRYAVQGSGPFQLDVSVEQDREEFRLPLDLAVRGAGWEEVHRVWVEGAGGSLSVCLDAVPLEVEPDPNAFLLLEDLSEGLGQSLPWVCGELPGDDDTVDDDDSAPTEGDDDEVRPPGLLGEGCACRSDGGEVEVGGLVGALLGLGMVWRRRRTPPPLRVAAPRLLRRETAGSRRAEQDPGCAPAGAQRRLAEPPQVARRDTEGAQHVQKRSPLLTTAAAAPRRPRCRRRGTAG